MSTDPGSTSHSHLLALPKELRLDIYDHLLSSSSASKETHGLRLVNKFIKEEYEHELFKCLTKQVKELRSSTLLQSANEHGHTITADVPVPSTLQEALHVNVHFYFDKRWLTSRGGLTDVNCRAFDSLLAKVVQPLLAMRHIESLAFTIQSEGQNGNEDLGPAWYEESQAMVAWALEAVLDETLLPEYHQDSTEVSTTGGSIHANRVILEVPGPFKMRSVWKLAVDKQARQCGWLRAAVEQM